MIKNILSIIVNIITHIVIKLCCNIKTKKSHLYFVYLKGSKNNSIQFKNSRIRNSRIQIKQSDNSIIFNSAHVDNSLINVQGTGNCITIKEGVKLRNSKIVLKGVNCNIQIGSGTTFNQIRIVNVGINNHVHIGDNCLFADNIELWASDTHSIYDKNGLLINPEKPVTIEDNVWVGSHVKILKGVTIGEGAIIGMNSLVTKNVAPKTLNVGIPLKCIKEDITWSLDYLKNRTQ